MKFVEDIFQPFWIPPIAVYIKHDTLPTNPAEATLMKRRASLYFVNGGVLYIRGLSTPLVKYLKGEKVVYTLGEVHEGITRQYLRAQALAKKVIIAKYYWVYMVQYAKKYLKK